MNASARARRADIAPHKAPCPTLTQYYTVNMLRIDRPHDGDAIHSIMFRVTHIFGIKHKRNHVTNAFVIVSPGVLLVFFAHFSLSPGGRVISVKRPAT